MKMSWFFQFMFQIKNLKTRWICCFQMMMINHIMCTLKISTDLCFTKQNKKQKNKKWFCKTCLQCFSGEIVLTKHEEYCLSINGKQSVKLEKGIIEFENYSKQIPVPFKIYADFECNLRGFEIYEGSYTKNIKIMLFVLMIGLLDQLLFIEVKMQLMNLLKQFIRSINIAKK